jgi:hypothetical protein
MGCVRSSPTRGHRAGALLTHRAAVPAVPATRGPNRPVATSVHRFPPQTAQPSPPSCTAAPGRTCRGKSCAQQSCPPGCRAIQLCIHYRERPTGFWVSRTNGWTVHRPWGRSCCQELDRDHRDVIRFPTWQDPNTAPRKGRAGAPRHGEDRTDQHASAPMELAATAGQDVDLPATTTGRSSNLNRNLLEHNLPACRVPGGRL